MPRIKDILISKLGADDAYMDNLPMPFRDVSDTPVNTVVSLRNGGGKTTMIKLVMSTLSPNQTTNVIGKDRKLSDLIIPGVMGVVAIRMSMDLDAGDMLALGGITGPSMVFGQTMEIRGNSPKRCFFSFFENDNLRMEDLPFSKKGNGSPTIRTFGEFRDWLERKNAVSENGCAFFDRGSQNEWIDHLCDKGIDKTVIDLMMRLNENEGVSETLGKFKESIDFIRYMAGNMVTDEQAGNLEDIVSSMREQMRDLPRVKAEYEFFEALSGKLEEALVPANEATALAPLREEAEGEAAHEASKLLALADRLEADLEKTRRDIGENAALIDGLAKTEESLGKDIARMEYVHKSMVVGRRKTELASKKAELASVRSDLDLIPAKRIADRLAEERDTLSRLRKERDLEGGETRELARELDLVASAIGIHKTEHAKLLGESAERKRLGMEQARLGQEAAKNGLDRLEREKTRHEANLENAAASLSDIETEMAETGFKAGDRPDMAALGKAMDAFGKAAAMARAAAAAAADGERMAADAFRKAEEDERMAKREADEAAGTATKASLVNKDIMSDEMVGVACEGRIVHPWEPELGNRMRELRQSLGVTMDAKGKQADDLRARMDHVAKNGCLPPTRDQETAMAHLLGQGIKTMTAVSYLRDIGMDADQMAEVAETDPGMFSGLVFQGNRVPDCVTAAAGLDVPVLVTPSSSVMDKGGREGTVILDRGMIDPDSDLMDAAIDRLEKEISGIRRSVSDTDAAIGKISKWIWESDLKTLVRESDKAAGNHKESLAARDLAGQRLAGAVASAADAAAKATEAENEAEKAARLFDLAKRFTQTLSPKWEKADAARRLSATALADLGRAIPDSERASAAATRSYEGALKDADRAKGDHDRATEEAARYPAPTSESMALARSVPERELLERELRLRSRLDGLDNRALAKLESDIAKTEGIIAEKTGEYGRTGVPIPWMDLAATDLASTPERELELDRRKEALLQSVGAAKKDLGMAEAELSAAGKKWDGTLPDPEPEGLEQAAAALSSLSDTLDAVKADSTAGKKRSGELREALLRLEADKRLCKHEIEDIKDAFKGRLCPMEGFSGDVEPVADAYRQKRAKVSEIGKRMSALAKEVAKSRMECSRLCGSKWSTFDKLPVAEEIGLKMDDVFSDIPFHVGKYRSMLASKKSVIDNSGKFSEMVVGQVTKDVLATVKSMRMLKTATTLSSPPDGWDEWRGQPVFRIDGIPGETAMEELAGEFVRTRLSTVGGMDGKTRNILVDCVCFVMDKARVTVLKPSLIMRKARHDIGTAAKWSNGERATLSIMLFAGLSKIISRTRKQAGSTGFLMLDNPFGQSNEMTLVQMQIQMARTTGLQLIYWTGLNDQSVDEFPGRVNIRNSHVDKSTNRAHVEIGMEATSSSTRESAFMGETE